MTPITFAPPCQLMSLNDRDHWAVKARKARLWRQRAGWAALSVHGKPGHHLPPCIVTVVLPVKGNRHRDPHNYFATVKPVVDGLVDAGCWPADTPEWVTTTEPRLDPSAVDVVVQLFPRIYGEVSA